MLFNFELRSLEDVLPWGQPGNYSLSWFGFTDGLYFIRAGKSELFRYTDELVAEWKEKYPDRTFGLPYVDYQVVRLYEDVLDMLPDILQPLPENLVDYFKSNTLPSSWYDQCNEWSLSSESKDPSINELTDNAMYWVGGRYLNPSCHLKDAG